MSLRQASAAATPIAGRITFALTHAGEQLLGRRGGLEQYRSARKTMGIPLLYPWANRLGSRRFAVDGREVNLETENLPLSFDAGGLSIHGLLGAAAGWQVDGHESPADGGLLAASFDFSAQPALIAAFPFPHRVEIEAILEGSKLTIATTVRPSADVAVPISFGFHPGGRRIELSLDEGYGFSQIYAPADDDVIAFEPMTAPANALLHGGPELRSVDPGQAFTAGFSIAISAV